MAKEEYERPSMESDFEFESKIWHKKFVYERNEKRGGFESYLIFNLQPDFMIPAKNRKWKINEQTKRMKILWKLFEEDYHQ